MKRHIEIVHVAHDPATGGLDLADLEGAVSD